MIFKKIKLSFLIAAAFLKREKKIILLGILFGPLLFFLLIKFFAYLPKIKKTEKIGLVGNYLFEDIPLTILNLASNGLTKVAPDGSAMPYLAVNWQIEEEGRVYVFQLAEDIYWQDGQEIKADQVIYELPQVKTEIIDSKSLKFSLKEPFAPFPLLVSTPVFKKNHIGTGEYQIKKVEKTGQFINQIFLSGPKKNLLFKFYPNEKTAHTAFKLGEVDALNSFYSNPFEPNWLNFLTVEEKINKNQYIGIFLNLRDKYLANKNLRQALAYATPKKDDASRTLGPFNSSSWAFNPNIKPYSYNFQQAKNLFDKFKKEAEVEKIKLQIDTTENFLSSAEEVKKSWQEILNIGVEIKLIDRISPDFQTLLIISQIPDDPDQYAFWHSTQTTNITGYKSPKVDKLLEDARRLENKQLRKEKYFDFQKFLLEDSPVIFLSYPKTYNFKRKAGFLN